MFLPKYEPIINFSIYMHINLQDDEFVVYDSRQQKIRQVIS